MHGASSHRLLPWLVRLGRLLSCYRDCKEAAAVSARAAELAVATLPAREPAIARVRQEADSAASDLAFLLQQSGLHGPARARLTRRQLQRTALRVLGGSKPLQATAAQAAADAALLRAVNTRTTRLETPCAGCSAVRRAAFKCCRLQVLLGMPDGQLLQQPLPEDALARRAQARLRQDGGRRWRSGWWRRRWRTRQRRWRVRRGTDERTAHCGRSAHSQTCRMLRRCWLLSHRRRPAAALELLRALRHVRAHTRPPLLARSAARMRAAAPARALACAARVAAARPLRAPRRAAAVAAAPLRAVAMAAAAKRVLVPIGNGSEARAQRRRRTAAQRVARQLIAAPRACTSRAFRKSRRCASWTCCGARARR
jgi:hypothetical protein